MVIAETIRNPFDLRYSTIMDTKLIELEFGTLSFSESGIVELHFNRLGDEIKEKDVEVVFAVLKEELKGEKCYLIVTTVAGAKMSQEAREFASSATFNEVSHADAIIRTDYNHEMGANFFIRVNKPDRPVQLFPSRDRAEKWLNELIAEKKRGG